MTSPPVSYRRTLGLFSGTMAVVGGIIGSGIFINPAIVAQRVGTAPLTLGIWILGGGIALIGAFCFGELGQRRPQAGGSYVYLREGLGALPAFLYAWALLLVMATGAIAAVAVTFASYAVPLLGLPPGWGRPLAAAAIAALTCINYLGIRPGAFTTNIFTVLKLVALGFLIAVGVAWAAPAAAAPAPPAPAHPAVAIAAALVPVLFAYGGWQQTNFIAEEIIDPLRNLPRALVLGVVIVVAVYLLANVAYLRMLGPAGLAASAAPAADAMRAALGPAGALVISLGITASTFGFLNLVIMVSPRVYRTLAADGLFFPAFAALHPTHRTPGTAILFQGLWAELLLFTGRYGQLLDYVVFCDWIFFGLCVVALFAIRRRDAAAGRTAAFRVPGWPVTPLLFIAASLYVVGGSIISNPRNALLGTAILLLGIPVFLFWKRRPPRAAPPGP
ncbi:MAG: amino acid permease [Gemmatimonadetes bacterium]|nr:amino acid permease [Gemmatimonadota bacterium]MBK7925647.1 amino acid permease [Gemmatimonadota bacterium]MBK9691089.1 amino acid permease [Gemmatimonadota bacterium]MBP9200389.1 amino acid permease [Gemmatimonadales bacterium]